MTDDYFLVVFGDVMWVCPAKQYISFYFYINAFIQSELQKNNKSKSKRKQ